MMSQEKETYESLMKKINELLVRKEGLIAELKVSEARRIPSELTKGIRDQFIINGELNEIQKQIESLNIKLLDTPKQVLKGLLYGELESKWIYRLGDFRIKLAPSHKWYVPIDEEGIGTYSYVETDSNNVPIRVHRYIRNSETQGYLIQETYDIASLDIQPNIEQIKPIPEEKQIPIKPCSTEDCTSTAQPLAPEQIMEYYQSLSIDEQFQNKDLVCPTTKQSVMLIAIIRMKGRCPSCMQVHDPKTLGIKRSKDNESKIKEDSLIRDRGIPLPNNVQIGNSRELHKDYRK
jgi:hypothetical protein